MKPLLITIIVFIAVGCEMPDMTLDECYAELEREQDSALFYEETLDVCREEARTPSIASACEVPDAAMEEALDKLQRLNSSLYVEIESLASAYELDLDESAAKYSGLLTEFRKLQCSHSNLAREYDDHKNLCELNDFGVWLNVEKEDCTGEALETKSGSDAK